MRPRTACAAALVSLFLLVAPRPALAGPWTKNLGEFYVKLGQSFFFSDSFRDSAGNLQQGIDYLGATTSVYYEVGVWKGLHLWGYLPYMVATNSFADDNTSWMRASGGDALLGVQYSPHFLPVPLPLAVKLEFKVPFYDLNGVEGAYLSRFPAPGDGQLDITLWLSAGGGLDAIPLYFFGEVGYRIRTEAFVGTGPFAASYVDGFVFFASVGYTFFERVVLALNTGGVIPVKGDTRSKGYVTFGPALYVPVWKGLAAEASFDPMLYTNDNASPGLGFTVGLSYKR